VSRQEVLAKTLKGMLEIVILKMLEEKPMHGYAFISIIRRRFGVYFGPSTIYPLLIKLQKMGCVVSEWRYCGTSGRPIKVYIITDAGRKLLEEGQNGLKIIIQPMIAIKQQ
jgi:DNA-binding PadR family transcriptional regulator